MSDDTTPIAWRAMPYRARVLSAEGTEIGSAESLLGDEESDIFHGIVVKRPHDSTLVEIAAAEITTITTAAVHTSVPQSQVAVLPAYRPEHWSHIEWGGLFRRHPSWKEE
ncbi:MAG: hypothetical protein ACREOS_00345 [Candidatus Dormibacteraceae bacterium]